MGSFHARCLATMPGVEIVAIADPRLAAAQALSDEVGGAATKDGLTVDAKSVLELLMLAAECGSELTIKAEGNDAQSAVQAIAGLIESRFGELDVDS